MITDPIPADAIRYNPATSSFEARVTVHGAGPAREYACAIEGGMDLTPQDAEKALRSEALRRHVHRPGLYSSTPTREPLPTRVRQDRGPSRSWLARFERLSSLSAA